MKQLLQDYKIGELKLYEVPVSSIGSGFVLVQNAYSLISAGTECSTVSTAQANLIEKARKRPDLVKQVLDNIKREGLLATYEKVKNRLDNVKAFDSAFLKGVCTSHGVRQKVAEKFGFEFCTTNPSLFHPVFIARS